MCLIHHLGKTLFDENALNLYNNLENMNVTGLKYCLFENFDRELKETPPGWITLGGLTYVKSTMLCIMTL